MCKAIVGAFSGSFKFISVILITIFLTGCVTTPTIEPRLRLQLTPATFGETISVQQHLKVERRDRTDELDAALEIDAQNLELVGLAFGQRVLSLSFDGLKFKTWRHFMLPSQVQAEDILTDVQLTLWPIDAIQKELPAHWRIEEKNLHRSLYFKDSVVTSIEYSDASRWRGTVILNNLRYQYRLTIQSAP
jgi:hypothetical protein